MGNGLGELHNSNLLVSNVTVSNSVARKLGGAGCMVPPGLLLSLQTGGMV